MNDILAKNIAIGLANPYLAVPQEFLRLSDSNGMHLFQNTLGTRTAALGAAEYHSGSSVASASNPGSNAHVIPVLGTYKGKKKSTARLWIATNRNDAMSEQKTIEFRLADNSQTTLTQGHSVANLSLVVANGIVHPDHDIPEDANSHVFRINVGPQSATYTSFLPTFPGGAGGSIAEIDFGGLFNTASKLLPVVAKSGFEIYNALKKNEQSPDSDSIFGDIGAALDSVAKIAVPIAGAILTG
jgi:hypothetical protein